MQHIQAASTAGGEDAEKLNVYRQQAALIARKKDAAVEQLRYALAHFRSRCSSLSFPPDKRS